MFSAQFWFSVKETVIMKGSSMGLSEHHELIRPKYNYLDNTRSSGYGSHSSGYESDCCPPVIDPLTYIAFLGFIALATYFLNQFIAMSMIEMASGRKKRESNEKEVSPLNEMSGFILMGMLQIIF